MSAARPEGDAPAQPPRQHVLYERMFVDRTFAQRAFDDRTFESEVAADEH
jgi:hypothetical protein